MTYGQPYAFDFGGPPRVGFWQEGYQPSSKEDTAFLSFFNTSSSDLAIDVSQYGTNLTEHSLGDGGSVFFTEVNTTRLAIDSKGRTIVARFLANQAFTGSHVIVSLDEAAPADKAWEMYLNGDKVYITRDTTIATCGLPSMPATDPPHEYSIGWSVRRDNTIFTPSELYVNELVVYNHTTNEITGAFAFSGNTATVAGSHDFSIGARRDGSSPFSNIDRIKKIQISSAYHSFSEFWTDNVQTIETRQPNCKILRDPLTMDRDSGVGNAQSFWGPVVQMTGNQHQSSSLRLNSPLINETFRNPRSWAMNTTDNNTTGSLWRAMPGSGSNSEFLMYSGWARWVEIPEHMDVNLFRWRANFEHSSIQDLQVRFVAMSKRPDSLPQVAPGDPPLSSFEMAFDQKDVPNSSFRVSVGNPGWVSGSCRIVREQGGGLKEKNTALVCLAVSGSVGGDATLQRFKLNAFQVWACNDESSDLDLGIGGG